MKITEISSLLGKLWRDDSIETKRPYVERELKERDKYKTDMAEWKRQQEEARKDSPVSIPITIANDGASTNLWPVVSWEEDDRAVTRDKDGDAQCSYGNTPHTPHTMGSHLRHQYMHPQYSSEEQLISRNVQNVYALRNNQDPHHCCSHSRLQQHSNCNASLTTIPNTDKQPIPITNAQFRHRWPANSALDRNNNGNTQSNDASKVIMFHNQQPYHDRKTKNEKDMFDVFLEAFGNTKPKRIKHEKVMDHFVSNRCCFRKEDEQHHHTQVNMEEGSRKLNQYEHHHQFMDREFPRRVSSEWLDDTQKQNNLPQCSGGNESIFSTFNDKNYEPLPLWE